MTGSKHVSILAAAGFLPAAFFLVPGQAAGGNMGGAFGCFAAAVAYGACRVFLK